jgi:hypothetical protein
MKLNPRTAEDYRFDVAPEFVCLSFLAWGPTPTSRFREPAVALALENNQ